MGQLLVAVMSCMLSLALLTLMGCSGQAPANEGHSQMREETAQRTVLDMPDWYRDLSRQSPEASGTVLEDTSTVRGYW